MFVLKSKYDKLMGLAKSLDQNVDDLRIKLIEEQEKTSSLQAAFGKQGGELLKSQELVKSLVEDVAMLLHDLEDRDVESEIADRIQAKSMERVEKARAFVKQAFDNAPSGFLSARGGIDVLENGQVKELNFRTQAELEAILARVESGELEIPEQAGL